MVDAQLAEILAKMKRARIDVTDPDNGPLRQALGVGARAVRDEARRLVAVSDGDGPHLREQIIAQRVRRPEVPLVVHYRVLVKFKARKYSNNRSNRSRGRVGQRYAHHGSFFYWRFLEEGTSQMAAKPFLRPAMDNNQSKIDALVMTRLARAVDKALKK